MFHIFHRKKILLTLSSEPFRQSVEYGKYLVSSVKTVKLKDVLQLNMDINFNCKTIEEENKKLDQLRMETGALDEKYLTEIIADTERVKQIMGSTFKCMLYSLFTKRYNAQKYRKIINEFHSLIMTLANRDSTRWGFNSTKEYADVIFKRFKIFPEYEKEYRENAIVVAQIGLGVGGMIIGLVGLLISIVLTLLK